jgi:hypothetical protein
MLRFGFFSAKHTIFAASQTRPFRKPYPRGFGDEWQADHDLS